ncbi:hypothetical protein NQ317_011426 [Molorchus minor]|uniref:MYND-type domain-containing protein n=1 Tax=Molorchus minor TaxID=1323400 RepID=A0ABQ9JPI0_9CUCU|nr:hypothetical protein NQ317_011426 [Molorchus minor]
MSSSETAGVIANSYCNVCRVGENLLRCARCKITLYCSKDHQKQDWKKHKVTCMKFQNVDTVEKRYGNIVNNQVSSAIPSEGSSENEILSSVGEVLSAHLTANNNFDDKSSTERTLKSARSAMPISGGTIVQPSKKGIRDFPEIVLHSSMAPFQHNIEDDILEEMCRNVIQDLNDYGLCVLDNFLGAERGKTVLSEVLEMQSQGVFRDGQLVSSKGKKEDLKTIRGDQICWVHGKEPNCPNIGYLINQVDAVIMRANRMANNGNLGQYNINGRTKVRKYIFIITW